MNNLNDTSPAAVLRFGPYTFHLRQRLILDGDRPLRMGGRALDILQVLVERAGRVVSKEQLTALIWPTSVVEEINLRVHIAALRRALKDGENGQRYIVNVPQCGYSFIAPVHYDSVAPVAFGPRHNLPARLTSIIGRDALVSDLVRRMPLSRLLTVSGPAGVGKTTVALRVAELLREHFRDGVWLIDLAQTAHDTPLLEQVLHTLDCDFPTLRGRHALLVLDSCDHQLEACKALAGTLLGAAPQLSILTTSREALQVRLEALQPVPPLSIPDRSATDCVAQAMSHSAVQLFVSRARARQHDFSLREQDLKGVGEICRLLDGLPLAIELAAAQIDALGLVGLQAQMDNGLQLLGHGRRTAVSRHQSMQAAFDWSYQGLSAAERRVLQQLSVFELAFTLDAAIGVICCAELTSSMIATIIEQLLQKSLLVVEQGAGAGRYRLLNTTRRCAREHLERSGEEIELERRHARYVARLYPVSDLHRVAQFIE